MWHRGRAALSGRNCGPNSGPVQRRGRGAINERAGEGGHRRSATGAPASEPKRRTQQRAGSRSGRRAIRATKRDQRQGTRYQVQEWRRAAAAPSSAEQTTPARRRACFAGDKGKKAPHRRKETGCFRPLPGLSCCWRDTRTRLEDVSPFDVTFRPHRDSVRRLFWGEVKPLPHHGRSF